MKLVSFTPETSPSAWQPIGDGVMGGRSSGAIACSETGIGEFHGTVRLDNGGGFASVKMDLPEAADASGWTGIEFRALGDGRTYKVGLRNSVDRRSIVYQQSFTPPTEEWGHIRLLFSDFIPTWRGKTVTGAGPLDVNHMASLSLFVSGRQAGEFSLRMGDWRLLLKP
jgi:NADH dehydrogenase [ubiquinone] 1 alpha subcomplex assembly factor 1